MNRMNEDFKVGDNVYIIKEHGLLINDKNYGEDPWIITENRNGLVSTNDPEERYSYSLEDGEEYLINHGNRLFKTQKAAKEQMHRNCFKLTLERISFKITDKMDLDAIETIETILNVCNARIDYGEFI